jgi:hypothetical protein
MPKSKKLGHLVLDPVLRLRAATALDRDPDLLRLIEQKNMLRVVHPPDLGHTQGAARHHRDNPTRDEVDPTHAVRLGHVQLLVARTPGHQVVIRLAAGNKKMSNLATVNTQKTRQLGLRQNVLA